MPPVTAIFLVLFMTLGDGTPKQQDLAGPFSDYVPCYFTGMALAQSGITVSVPEDATNVHTRCVSRVSE